MATPKPSPKREERRTSFLVSESEFTSKTLEIRRVARMVAGGRRFRFRALVATGNRKGTIGIGLGKGQTVAAAVEKATRRARTNTITIPLKKGTIPREISLKEGTAHILLRPARPGHGIVAGGVIRALCDLAGITDISAKILSRSTNPIANARATIKALRQLAERTSTADHRKSRTILGSEEHREA